MGLFLIIIIAIVWFITPKKPKYVPKINPNSLLNPYKDGWMDNENYTNEALCKRYDLVFNDHCTPYNDYRMNRLFSRIANYTREVDK